MSDEDKMSVESRAWRFLETGEKAGLRNMEAWKRVAERYDDDEQRVFADIIRDYRNVCQERAM